MELKKTKTGLIVLYTTIKESKEANCKKVVRVSIYTLREFKKELEIMKFNGKLRVLLKKLGINL